MQGAAVQSNQVGRPKESRWYRRAKASAALRVGASLMVLVAVAGTQPASAQSTSDDPAQIDAGMAVYESSCAGCHGVDGEGSNAGRPLIGIAAQQPDRLVHVASVTDGKGGMPAFGAQLDSDEIDAAVSYLRLSFVDEDLEELPLTGASDTMPLFGAGLLAAGGLLLLIARRNSGVTA